MLKESERGHQTNPTDKTISTKYRQKLTKLPGTRLVDRHQKRMEILEAQELLILYLTVYGVMTIKIYGKKEE